MAKVMRKLLGREAETTAAGDELLTLDEVCALVKLGKSTIYRMVKAGDFPQPKKLPTGTIRWTRGSIRRWIERLPDAELSEDVIGEEVSNESVAA